MANTHKAIMIAETSVNTVGIHEALQYLGAPEWLDNADATSASALLAEFAGRLCYKSFKPGLNPNVTKVREGNKPYLKNVLSQKHGSVLEHGSVTFALLNVSRIFTHELVRHRPGMAYSQESQRYVRLDDFQMYIPDLTPALSDLFEVLPDRVTEHWDSKDAWVQRYQDKYVEAMNQTAESAKELVSEFVRLYGLNEENIPFHVKKRITSALRRMLPGGVNTHIIVTGNHRAWRHIISMRTSEGAEDEAVEIIGDVARQMLEKFEPLYQDILCVDGKYYSFENGSV